MDKWHSLCLEWFNRLHFTVSSQGKTDYLFITQVCGTLNNFFLSPNCCTQIFHLFLLRTLLRSDIHTSFIMRFCNWFCIFALKHVLRLPYWKKWAYCITISTSSILFDVNLDSIFSVHSISQFFFEKVTMYV